MEIETLILGAGAAGLFCASRTGPGTLVVDHAKAPAEKVRISGGGRCNFTNIHTEPGCFLSENPHFAKSALARYTPWDFVSLVSEHGIAWHEKTLGQLFCDDSSRQIIDLLLAEAPQAEVRLRTELAELSHDGSRFRARLRREGRDEIVTARRLVVATGGKSIPKMGASGLSYDIARQFGHALTDIRPALVPFTFPEKRFAPLSGVATPVRASAERGPAFDEALLFTHRGLSGPAMLQVSSYWEEGEEIAVSLNPAGQLYEALRSQRQARGRIALTTALGHHLPGRLVAELSESMDLSGNLADQSDAALTELCDALSDWRLRPGGTEGYRTAEVTAGGVATDGLSSKTMESKTVPGLYFIGECVDVTGWLGGYNFQWAWASAHAAGTAIASA